MAKKPCILLLFFSAILPLISSETDQNGIIYYNTQNTTQGSPLERNIQNVLNRLVNAAPVANGSYVCRGKSPDDACGISICYNQISSGDCIKCLRSAKSYFQQVAPLAIGARYTESKCRLHYENGPFNDADYGAPSSSPSPPPPPPPCKCN